MGVIDDMDKFEYNRKDRQIEYINTIDEIVEIDITIRVGGVVKIDENR